jgi:soluble lytic murein transglycosylase-like protein
MGIALGILAAVSALFFVVKKSPDVILEKDISHTLGLADEKTPAVALRPWTTDELALELGLSNSEDLSKWTQIFAERISEGFLPKDWADNCHQSTPQTLCEVVEDYFSKQAEVFSYGADKRKNVRLPLFDVKYIAQLQKEEYSILLSRLPDWDKSKMVKFSQAALETGECPKNFSLALSRKWETLLTKEAFEKRAEPSEQEGTWNTLRRLEKEGLSCLKLDDNGAEFAFFKAGVWDYLEGDFENAIRNFEQSLVTGNRKEEYRVRFWYMRALQKLGKTNEVKIQSQLLKEKYPASFYTLVTKVSEGEDPLTIFQSSPLYSDSKRPDNELVSLRFFWLLALLEQDNVPFAVKRYGEFFVRTMGAEFDPGLIQYLARSFDRVGFHRLQIMALNQIIVQKPTQVNIETLRLLFPRPFFDELDKMSSQIDVALLLGLSRQESGFDPSATSGANARGLMQILPSTAKGIKKRMHHADLYDYEKNIEVGGKFLLRLIQMFDGSVEKSLAAYNAGQGILKKWEVRYGFISDPLLFLDAMPYRETRDYVPSILRNAYWYHRLFPEMREGFEKKGAVTSEMLKGLL